MKNKKGMLGNMIGGFVIIMVAIMLLPTITQQLELAINCNVTEEYNQSQQNSLRETNSFGGGGSAHFGGYDGTVEKSWDYKKYSLLKNREESVFGNHCEISGGSKTIVKLVPWFFILAVISTAFAIIAQALKEAGIIEPEVPQV